MYRYFFIAKNNMKKQKGDMITFFIMTFLASFMIFICLNLLVGTFRVIETNRKETNAADLFVIKSEDEVVDFKLRELIQGNENFEVVEESKYLSIMGKYRKKGAKNWSDYPFHIGSYEDEREIQKISTSTKGLSGNDIILPISLSTSYSLGDKIELKISDNIYEFKVAGFNEDYIYCSPMNFGTYLIFVSEKRYQEMLFENPGYAAEVNNFKILLTQDAKDKKIDAEAELDKLYNDLLIWSENYKAVHPEYTRDLDGNFIPGDLMATASMILPFMFIAIILVFALIVLAIALVVIDFSIKNFILDNMKNTGIMEAGGYTVKEMMIILLVQLLSVSAAGSFGGVLLGALVQKTLGYIMLFLLGLSWNQSPDMAVFFGVAITICLIISVFALILGRDYKKTTVLEALRGGINAHNFKKNVFPFDKSSLPIFVNLALKETFGKFKSQIGVILIMTVLAFSAAMGFGIYENMGKDVDSLLRLSGLDLYDADFSGDIGMYDVVKNFNTVDKTHYETWVGLTYVNGNKSKSINTRAISNTDLMREEMMVEGRWPKHENEVALGTMAANNLGKEVGDTIIVKNGEEEASYLVTGIMQTFNNMGMMAYMTTDGYQRIGKIPSELSYRVDLKKVYTFADLEKEFKDAYPDEEITDELASTGSLFSMLKISMKSILVIIMVVTALIVALAEALLIRTRITKEWRNLGVNKALGFTSDQLILQVMLSNIPAIIIGIILGLITVTLFGGKLCLLMFAIFGFRKVKFALSPLAYVSVIIVIIGVAMLVSWLNGKRIKKLEPVKMITEE